MMPPPDALGNYNNSPVEVMLISLPDNKQADRERERH